MRTHVTVTVTVLVLLLAACTSAAPSVDSGLVDASRDAPDVPSAPDVVGDVVGDAGGCAIPGYGTCAPGRTCEVARCPDGTPVSCSCSADSMPRCTGACPPLDGGGGPIECGGALGLVTSPACTPHRAVLDPNLCRCILGYAWDGTRCASLANCRCFANCGEVFPTREGCEAAFAACLDAGR